MDFIYVSCTMCTFIVKLTWQQFHTIFLIILCTEHIFTEWDFLLLVACWCWKCLASVYCWLWVCGSGRFSLCGHPLGRAMSEDTPCPSPLRHGQVRGTKASLASKWGHWRLPEPSWSPHYTDCLLLCYLVVKEHTRKDKLKLHNLGKSVTRLLVANCTLAVH